MSRDDPSHPASVEAARAHAVERGVEDRVTFEIATGRSYETRDLDLVCFFDCLHDLGDSEGAARHAAGSLTDGGTVLLVEPFAGDAVEDDLNVIGQMHYAASTTLCCAHALCEEGGYALGAQAGEARLREAFEKAGFGQFRGAVETPFNLVLEARL